MLQGFRVKYSGFRVRDLGAVAVWALVSPKSRSLQDFKI